MHTIDKEYLLAFADKLLHIDSPSGYTMNAIQYMEEEAATGIFMQPKCKR